MATKTTSKKTTTKKTPAKKPAAKKAPRMSASAARAEGAARTKRASHEAKAKTEAKQTATPAKARRPSGLDHAAQVLAKASEPLAAKTIAERAIADGWATKGKTPHATLYAAMTREITAKGNAARFAKTGRGLFTVPRAPAK